MDFLRMLLDAVVESVFPPRDHERLVRALTESEVLACLDPAVVERAKPAAIALARFRAPAVRALVHEGKYRSNQRAQDMLGMMLARYLADWRAEDGALYGKDARVVLVPVPLSKKRRAERGYNQCEEIARRALARADMKPAGFELDASLLLRPKDTEHQTRLGRVLRRQNLSGAFAAARPADPDALYIVVDDVVTTGATLEAAIAALHEAGARSVQPLAIAH
jgi:ComF family protein